ncbi:uncharacterized protein CBL_02096 [Carabus blaptoides fortunei]
MSNVLQIFICISYVLSMKCQRVIRLFKIAVSCLHVHRCKCLVRQLHSAQSLPAPKALRLAYASYEGTRSHSASEPLVPPLIIMHGLFGSKGNWNSLSKVFNARTVPQRKVIAVDARNHGDSPHASEHSYEAMAQDIRQLMLDIDRRMERVALLGHSMGGRAMMLFALQWPELVDRLIVADISPVSTSNSENTMLRYFEVLQSVTVPDNVSLSAARVLADTHLARVIPDKGVRAFLLTNLVQKADGSFRWRMNIDALLTNYHKITQFSIADGLKYEGPTLFIAGGASDYIQKRDHGHIKQLFPNAEFQTIDGAGHWLHSEKPHEFVDICLDILNRT